MTYDNTQETLYPREIKSYVLRSRMTPKQREGLELFWPIYGLTATESGWDFEAIFGNQAPVIIEIGFGMGHSLLEFGERNPDINFIGIEVHRPGVGAVLSAIHAKQLKNIRICVGDANEVLVKKVPDQQLLGTLLFFPDPWPKRRHQKRRIVQPEFVSLIYRKLKPKGYFHLATDVELYYAQMQEILNNHSGFAIMSEHENLPASLLRPKTKFSCKGNLLGHTINDLIYIKDR